MKKEDLQKAFADLKEHTLEVFREMMEDAPNLKTGERTLGKSSNIYHNTKVEEAEMGVVNIIIPFYIQYLDGIDNETGQQYEWARRPKALRGGYQGGPAGFAEAIEKWMIRRGISLENGGLYRMLRGIEKNGIRPRQVFVNWEKKMDELLSEWMDGLFDTIMKEMDDYFKNK